MAEGGCWEAFKGIPTFLLEVACSQDSVLTQEVQKQGLRAMRCSWWKEYDLSSNSGLRRNRGSNPEP